MPRCARVLSSSSIYHVMIRGNERKEIFRDDEDKERFLDTLYRMMQDGKYTLYAYCLMDNHVHLLIRDGEDSIKQSMKRIGVSYVRYFNRKYMRVGHLAHDRFRSEVIEDEAYLLMAVRYIHNNPVKAGMVQKVHDYPWSSYGAYMHYDSAGRKLIDTRFLLDLFSANTVKAVELFSEYMSQKAEDVFIDDNEDGIAKEAAPRQYRKIDEEIGHILEKFGVSFVELQACRDKKVRNAIIREIKENTNVSIRDLAKLLGLNKDIILRA